MGQKAIEFPAATVGAAGVTAVFFLLMIRRLRRVDFPWKLRQYTTTQHIPVLAKFPFGQEWTMETSTLVAGQLPCL